MANFVSNENALAIITKIGQKFDALGAALVFRGSLTFSNLPATLTAAMRGFTYNVTDAFTTDSRFVEGSGKAYPAGTNISVCDASYYTAVEPVGNEDPSSEGWYELDDGEYVLSEDTTVDSEKTYYAKTADYKFDVLAGFIDITPLSNKIAATQGMIAGTFAAANAYAIGDVVIHEDGLYKFTSAHTAGDPWSNLEVAATTVDALIDAAEPDNLTTEQVNALLALLD